MSFRIPVTDLCEGEFLVEGNKLYLIGKTKMMLVPVDQGSEKVLRMVKVTYVHKVPKQKK
jgi:Tfp pilus assembly protein PilZ